MRLLLDLDGVVVDFIGAAYELFFERTGVLYHPQDLKQHSIAGHIGQAHYDQMEEMFNEPGFFLGLKPYPGALDHVNGLIDEGHEVFICTSPTMMKHPTTGKRVVNGKCAEEKFAWVHDHLPRLTRRVSVSSDKHLFRADALLDDGDHNIIPWAEAHADKLAVVIEQPWNEKLAMPKNSVRATLANVSGVLLLARGG